MKLKSLLNSLCPKRNYWWIKIDTAIPPCIYYFGPFNSAKEAIFYRPGYIEDLVQEKAQGITVEVKKLQPEILTVFEE